jgi:subtilase family serine protease
MTSTKIKFKLLTAVALAAALVGCGGGGSDVSSSALNGSVSGGTTTALSVPSLSNIEATAQASPFFSGSPVAEPATVDGSVPAKLGARSVAAPTYTPAQIRTAYQLPALPASWTGLTAAQAAQFGAGQTIYILDAYHNPNVVDELAAFNAKFGLPSCTTVAISASASLPLAPASAADGCKFSRVYAYTNGGMTSTAPSYDATWAKEIALDVQWAHATAPLARIILVEAPSADTGGIMSALNVINNMGNGVVSMSFGIKEGSWVTSMDSLFFGANMTYVASAGDSGAGVSWPSVSKRVLAIGGTSLKSYTSTARNEVTWSSTGGGISQYVAVPTYQTSSVLGMSSQTYRNVADVAFNADPNTGQYTAVISPGSSSPTWYSMGGTSLAAPQWAGVIAVTNAVRAQNSQGPLGLVQNFIYKVATTTSSFFTAIVNDITIGNDGGYSARTGYDQPTGLGTPNASSFIALAGGSSAAQIGGTPPSVSDIAVSGVEKTAMSFSVAYTSPNSVTWDLTNAPEGMTINSSGLISWPLPVASTTNYLVTATATDTVSGLKDSAIATVTVEKKKFVPYVSSASTMTGQAGRPLNYEVVAQSQNPVSMSFVGDVPAGLTISTSGHLNWQNPVEGTYALTIKATDTKTLVSGSSAVIVQISNANNPIGPVITAPSFEGTAGVPLAGTISTSDSDGSINYYSLLGNPAGMTLRVSGQQILMRWDNPVRGSYALKITVIDNKKRSAQAIVPVTIR